MTSNQHGRVLRRVAAVAVLFGLTTGIAGCRKTVEIVPVRGKITFHGGAWPKGGIVNFTPFKPAEGFPGKAGSGRFEADGVFTAKTGDEEGLIPGEYRIAVSCWQKPPDDLGPGLSYLPDKFTNPSQSGLTLKIDPGQSGPVVWEHDFPARTK
jgi:hypothetical protein